MLLSHRQETVSKEIAVPVEPGVTVNSETGFLNRCLTGAWIYSESCCLKVFLIVLTGFLATKQGPLSHKEKSFLLVTFKVLSPYSVQVEMAMFMRWASSH